MPVPPLPTTGPAVPRALDAVVQRLLCKEPAERYLSAAAVVADLTALLHALEITETATLTDLRDVVATLHQLQSLGVRIALDDFGTGYSPLSYLQQLPVDYLKVDRSFVRSMTTHREDAAAIVRGVVEMAHALGMLAVAEGVEHAEQLALLQDMGGDLAQGYLWMPPVPVEQLGRTIVVPGPRSAPSPMLQ